MDCFLIGGEWGKKVEGIITCLARKEARLVLICKIQFFTLIL